MTKHSYRIALLSLALCVGLVSTGLASSAGDVKKKLSKALKKHDKALAAEAISEAGALPKGKGVKLLVGKLVHLGAMGLVGELADALAAADDLAAVVKAAGHKSSEVRYVAIRALGARSEDGAKEAVLKALDDKAELVAVAAVRAAQRKPNKELLDRFVKTLLSAEQLSGKKARPNLTRELITALQNLTGETIDAGVDWDNYWKAHREKWAPKADDGKGGDDKSVMDRMRKHRKADTKTLERLSKTDVIAVLGVDKVQDVLKSLKIDHTRIKREELADMELSPNSVLVLNCAGSKSPFSEKTLAKIERFVAAGGYVFSSDWELKRTIQPAFPGTIEFAGESKKTPRGSEEKATILPVKENHPYLRDVFPMSTMERAGFKWTLDGRSHLIKIVGKGVTPLVQCPSLGKQFKRPFVAVTFRWNGRVVSGKKRRVASGGAGGKEKPRGGAVLHVLGHFKNQKNAAEDKFALQQLLLNFILEKQRDRRLLGG